MGFLPNTLSCGCGGSTVSWLKSNLISSACLLTNKKTTLEFFRVVFVSVTYLMYIPKIIVVGEDAAETTSMM